MADTFVFSNFAVGALQEAVDQFSTTLRIAADDAAKLPTLVSGTKAPIVLADTKDNVEICYITAKGASGELTVERAREGTAARSWSAGTQVEHVFTAASLLAAAKVNPRGVWSAIVNYVAGDVVTHNDVAYLAVQPSLNQIPSSGSAFWQTFFVPPGVSASAMAWQGAWNSGVTYALGAVASWRGRLVVSIQAGNLNHLPSDAAWWTSITVGPGELKHLPVLAAAGTNNYTVAPSPAVAELFDGAELTVVFANANTAAATLQVSALAPAPLRPKKGTEFASGEIIPNEPYKFTYFAGTTEFVAVDMPVVSKKLADILASISAAEARITALENSLKFVPVGIMVDYMGGAVPSGWLLCFGQAVSRVTYAALFTAIGTAYGVGDGVNTFNLPDSRGRTTVGLDNMGGVAAGRLGAVMAATALGQSGGTETVTLTIPQLPVVTPSGTVLVTYPAHSYQDNFHLSNGAQGGGAGMAGTFTSDTRPTGVPGPLSHSLSMNSFGGGQAHSNLQPSIAVNKMIFAGVA